MFGASFARRACTHPPDSCAADWVSGESRHVPDGRRSMRSSGGDVNLTVSCGCANDEVAGRRLRGSIVGGHGGGQRQKPVGAKRSRRGRTSLEKRSRMKTNVDEHHRCYPMAEVKNSRHHGCRRGTTAATRALGPRGRNRCTGTDGNGPLSFVLSRKGLWAQMCVVESQDEERFPAPVG